VADGATIVAFGDAAVLIQLGGEGGVAAAARAQAVASLIRSLATEQPGWGAVVPAAASVLVHVDPVTPGVEAAISAIREALEAGLADHEAGLPDHEAGPAVGPAIEIPVRYGGGEGPDLDEVADLTGLSAESVIEAHASMEYRVLFLGFAPGFAYLGPLPPSIVVPRRASPRVRVPSGSVAVAGPNTAVYPVDSPGGWRILGRTSVGLWDPRRDPPALLEPGAVVRFVPDAR
jgi:KipI family sensor histidine kinase inhibitor